MYFISVIKSEFSASLLQSSVSHDPSEIILICWLAVQETFIIIIIIIINISRTLWWTERSKYQHLSELKSFCNIIHYTIQELVVRYIYIYIYSAAWKFVNPLELSIFLHKYDPKHHQTFAQVLKVDKENPIKQMRQIYIYFIIYLLREMNHCYTSVSCKSMWIFAFSIWCDPLLQQ